MKLIVTQATEADVSLDVPFRALLATGVKMRDGGKVIAAAERAFVARFDKYRAPARHSSRNNRQLHIGGPGSSPVDRDRGDDGSRVIRAI